MSYPRGDDSAAPARSSSGSVSAMSATRSLCRPSILSSLPFSIRPMMQAVYAYAGVEMVGGEILIRGAAVAGAVEQFEALHAAHTFQEVRLLFGAAQYLFLLRCAQRPVPQPAHGGVQQRGRAHHRAQQRTVDPHHRQCGGHHHTVYHRLDATAGEGTLNSAERFETRHHVAEMAFLEIYHGQAQQMTE